MLKRSSSSLLYLLLIILPVIILFQSVQAVDVSKDDQIVTADRLPETEKIVIDGALTESVWQQVPITRPLITMYPTFGSELTEKTEIWTAFDDSSLYFAFKCYDTQPDRIKTSIAQRDKIDNDDQVGVWIDSTGTQQSSYEFYINPNGIQMDGINSSISKSDYTPDFIWESAAQIGTDGYTAEIRIPLETVRYQVGKNDEVKMRVIFFRRISRLGAMATWPTLYPGRTDFNCMTTLLYKGIKKSGLKLEVLPNFTYSSNSERINADTWETTNDTNFGVGLKYGITSSITAEATVNPDFSQVESDVFQMELNQRFPVFNSEKRPFFMESKDVLDFTIVHDTMASVLERGMMVAPIHTRSIVDPGWAFKLSGSAGKTNFAFLTANDRAAVGDSALIGIFRAKYNIGEDNAVGILYTGRQQSDIGENNHVGGVDLKYRLSKNLRASFSYLNSSTRASKEVSWQNAGAWNAVLQYLSPSMICMGAYERYGNQFYMASAFQNRVGISRFWFGIGPYLNVNIKHFTWLKRAVPYIHYAHLHDLSTGMNDISRVFGMYMNFAPMGILYLEYRIEDEAWKGKDLRKKYFTVLGDFQLTQWLHLSTNMYLGDQLSYASIVPFVGSDRSIGVGITVEPSIKLKMILDYYYTIFKDKVADQEIYSGSITNFQLSYQFNKYFFLRGIMRYDGLQDKLLTDLLASFTLIPGTVVQLGYGSLYLKNQWLDNQWVLGQGKLINMRRGLFFKASYLWRIK